MAENETILPPPPKKDGIGALPPPPPKKKVVLEGGTFALEDGVSGQPPSIEPAKLPIEEFDPENLPPALDFSIVTQTAAEVAQKKATAFGTNYLDEFQSELDTIKVQTEKEAKELQDYMAKAPPTEELTFMDRVKELGSDPIQLVPFLSGAAETGEMFKLFEAAERLDKDIATKGDLLLLKKFSDEGTRDTSFWYEVMDVMAQLPSFAGELLITGGIYTAVKKATAKGSTTLLKKLLKEGGKELLEKKLAQITVSAGAGIVAASAQTVPAGITRITAGTFRNMMPDIKLTEDEQNQIIGSITKEGDNVLLAATKALGEQWIETVSEKSGGLFNSVGRAGKEMMIRHGILKSFLKANPKAKISDFMKGVKRAGYDGIISEMAEERVGEIGRAAIGLEEYQLPTRRQLLVELVSFSIPGLTIAGVNRAVERKQTKEGLKQTETEIEEAMPLTEAEQAIKKEPEIVKEPIVKEKPKVEEAEEIPDKARPTLYVEDMEGMNEGAKVIKTISDKTGEKIQLQKNEDGEIFAVDSRGEVVGFYAKLSETEADLSVAKEYQQRGIGAKLVTEFIKANPTFEIGVGGLTRLGKKTILAAKREEKPEVEIAPELRKYTKATEEKYGYIQEEGKPKRELTREEFEAEQAIKEELPVELLEVREETEITPEEFEKAKETKEFTTEDEKYIITKTEKGLDVFNTTTQKSVKPQAAPHKEAIEQYKESIIPSLKRGEKAKLFPGMEPKEVSRKIADKSENPQEIAGEYLSLTGETKVEKTLEDDIAELLSERRVTREAFTNANDPKNITQAIQLNYFKAPLDEFGRRTDAARAFDTLVERLKEIGEGKYEERDEQELIESIGEFMTENPNGPKTYLAKQKRRPDIKALEDRFFELTKFDITEDFAKKLVEEKPLDIAEINKELLSLSKKEEIPDATIRQFEARTGAEGQELEQRATDIESKAESSDEARLNEAVREADEFLKPTEKPPKPPVEEKTIEPSPEEENAKEFVKEFNKQTKEKILTPLKTLITKVFKKNYLTEKFFDDKAFAKRQLEKAGAIKAIWKKNITLGSGAESKTRVEEMVEETFGTPFENKLTPEEKSNLNTIILFRRTITLDDYRDAKGEKRLKHTVLKIRGKDVALTKELAETWLNSFKAESPERFKKLNERADKYFKNNKELLKNRLDEGLIDQETFDRLVLFDYSKRIFVERMMDLELIRDSGFYTDSEIKALKEGSEDLLFDDAESLLTQNISSTTRLIFENRSNKALGEFFEKNETDFGKIQKSTSINKETGQPKYPKAPIGWKEIKYKEKGQIKSILTTTDFYKSWTSKDPIIKQSAATAIQWATGTKPIKFFATGVNPFFAFYNFVRDPGHVYFFTDTYSIFLPKATMQLGKDLFTVAKDAWTKKGRTREYTREGGAMDFLTTQGVAKSALPKTKIGAATNVAIDIASKLNHTSEMIVRLSVRERQIKDLTSAFIKENERDPTEEEKKDIRLEATSKARAAMDFSQKGEWIRAADNFLPYLAASFQGLNVAARAFRQRPLETSARIAQGIGLVVGATLYNMQWDDDDEKNGVLGYNHVPDYVKSIGMVLMMPFTTTNNKGDKVRPYVIIPIPHEFSIFKTPTESVTQWAKTGDFKGKPITKSLKIAIPVRDPRDVPIIDFLYAYELGYDRFRDKYIWKDAKIKAEAEFTLRTPEIYKDIGKATGLSPDRMKLAAGKLFTQHESNIYSIAFSAGYENVKNLLETDKEKKEFNDMAAKAIEDGLTPLQRRFYRYPSKSGKEKDIIEEAVIAENTKRKLEEKDKVYEFISEYRKADKAKKTEIEIEVKRFANKMERESVGAKSRILNTFNKSKKVTTIKSRFIINLIYAKASPEANATAFFEVWKESSEDERIELKRDVRKAGLMTDRFNKAFRKLKRQ